MRANQRASRTSRALGDILGLGRGLQLLGRRAQHESRGAGVLKMGMDFARRAGGDSARAGGPQAARPAPGKSLCCVWKAARYAAHAAALAGGWGRGAQVRGGNRTRRDVLGYCFRDWCAGGHAVKTAAARSPPPRAPRSSLPRCLTAARKSTSPPHEHVRGGRRQGKCVWMQRLGVVSMQINILASLWAWWLSSACPFDMLPWGVCHALLM
eukprot:93307-Chlamydomonas_euryale.AAC.1